MISVRPSVSATFLYKVKMAKHIIRILSPAYSPVILGFLKLDHIPELR